MWHTTAVLFTQEINPLPSISYPAVHFVDHYCWSFGRKFHSEVNQNSSESHLTRGSGIPEAGLQDRKTLLSDLGAFLTSLETTWHSWGEECSPKQDWPVSTSAAPELWKFSYKRIGNQSIRFVNPSTFLEGHMLHVNLKQAKLYSTLLPIYHSSASTW